jgi:hypothetical protein
MTLGMQRRWLGWVALWLLAACAGPKSDARKMEEQEQANSALRAEVDAWKRRAADARSRTQSRLGGLPAEGSGMVLFGGNAGLLEVRWSSAHAGQRLDARVQPGAPAEMTQATVSVTRGSP